MKRIAKLPLLLIAIPWALILMLVQTVHGGGMARGGDPAYPGSRLGGGGGGGTVGGVLTAANMAANPFFNIVLIITDLTPDQQTRLTTASTEVNTKLIQWQTSSQAVLQPLALAANSDQAALDAYNAELYKQNLLREDIRNDAEIAMVAILTPAQAEQWEASRLNTQLNAKLAPLGPTDAQKAAFKPLVADAAKKLAAAKDKPTLVQSRADFWKQIAPLLTDIQTNQIFAPTFTPAARGPRGGAGPGAGGAFGGGAAGGTGGTGGAGGTPTTTP